jgi:hypothetical protein
MSVLNFTTVVTGLAGVSPAIVYIDTNDTIATVLTAGYLNPYVRNFGLSLGTNDMALVNTTTGTIWAAIAISAGNTSLVPADAGSVILPTITNHIATYAGVNGQLSEDPATAISGGNIQAGLSGTAGYLASFPATLARGSLHLVGANSAGDTVTTITNASQAAARAFTIPDGGQVASSFLLTDNAGTQTIATGSLALTVGTLTLGSSGHASTLTIFPGTAANGSFIISPVNNAGNHTTTLSSVTALAQNTVYTLPDPAAATANIILSASGGTQTISTGSLALSVGTLTLGSSGHASSLTLFPGTAANGTLIVAPVNAGGAFNTTISNGIIGQSTVFSLPDPGNAVSQILAAATATPFTANHLVTASATSGLVKDSGFAMATVDAVTPGASLVSNAAGTLSFNNVSVISTSVTLTAAQFNGMYAAPFQIVAAPGAGKTILVSFVQYYLNYSAAFTGGGATNIQYGNTVHGGGQNAEGINFAAATFTAGASTIIADIGPLIAITTGATNAGIFLSNATGAYANGAGSTVTVTVQYVVLTATV